MTPDQIIAVITEELKAKHGCHTIILYGSRARGDAIEISDYDIMGVRESGTTFRDARLWNGAYLDIFVYPESALLEPRDSMLDMRHGKILFQKSDFATRFFDKLEKIFQAGPKKLRADETQALRTWHDKALARIRAGGLQGNNRRSELLPAMLEHYFTTRGEWYRGPKASFQWLETNKPKLFKAFETAYEPNASVSSIETLVVLVNSEIEKEAKAACPPEEIQKPKTDLSEGGIIYANRKQLEDFHETLGVVAREKIYIEMIEAPEFSKTLEFFQKQMTHNWPAYYAIENGRVVGWADICTSPNPRTKHRGGLGMGVLPSYRGKGIGTKLLAKCLDHAKLIGMEKVELTVFTANANAIALYKKLGFVEEGVIKSYRKLDDKYFDCLAMGKFL